MSSTLDQAHRDYTVNENKTYLVDGCFCCNDALYFDCPKCIGCSGKYEFCCLQEAFCCKPGVPCLDCTPPSGQGICCQIGCGIMACAFRSPRVCLKGQGHCCCLVNSCAFPCDKEVRAPERNARVACCEMSIYASPIMPARRYRSACCHSAVC